MFNRHTSNSIPLHTVEAVQVSTDNVVNLMQHLGDHGDWWGAHPDAHRGTVLAVLCADPFNGDEEGERWRQAPHGSWVLRGSSGSLDVVTDPTFRSRYTA